MPNIELTDKGKRLATLLAEQTSYTPASARDDLDVTGPADGRWTLANDVLLFIAGEYGEPVLAAEQNVASIADALLPRLMDVPRTVLEEIVEGLVDDGLLAAARYPAVAAIEWLCRVNLDEHPRRIVLLNTLAQGPATASDLRRKLGNVPVMTLRHHLIPLVEMGFVQAHRKGKEVEYAIDMAMVKAFARRQARALQVPDRTPHAYDIA